MTVSCRTSRRERLAAVTEDAVAAKAAAEGRVREQEGAALKVVEAVRAELRRVVEVRVSRRASGQVRGDRTKEERSPPTRKRGSLSLSLSLSRRRYAGMVPLHVRVSKAASACGQALRSRRF